MLILVRQSSSSQFTYESPSKKDNTGNNCNKEDIMECMLNKQMIQTNDKNDGQLI